MCSTLQLSIYFVLPRREITLNTEKVLTGLVVICSFLLHTDFDDIRVLHKHSFKIYEINIFFLLIDVSKKKMTPQKVKNDTHLNIN